MKEAALFALSLFLCPHAHHVGPIIPTRKRGPAPYFLHFSSSYPSNEWQLVTQEERGKVRRNCHCDRSVCFFRGAGSPRKGRKWRVPIFARASKSEVIDLLLSFFSISASAPRNSIVQGHNTERCSLGITFFYSFMCILKATTLGGF